MLTDHLFLISIVVLALVVLCVLGIVLYFAARRSSAKPSQDPKVAKLRFDSLRSSFRQAVELIEGNIASRSARYSIPWIMVLNEGDQQNRLPIAQSGVSSALSVESASAAATQGISWSFFDRGVVIDIQGEYLGSPDDDDAAEKPWDEFLGLCRSYRPQRPFDSVVVTIPASLLIDDSADGRLELARRAKLAHRRLWLAQNRFAMRFAVYVLVTGGEQIEGFSSFARALPESMRSSILGWSSPYDLSSTYQAIWVDEAVGSMVRSVSDVSSELFASQIASTDAGLQLLLPNRIDSLRPQLQLFMDELMRPSAYHEPFFLRGVYLTGDGSEAAQAIVALDAGPLSVLDAENAEQGDLISQLIRQPVFLRDLFEKKIFQEYGLTRPSRTQTLTRPVLHRTARWAAVIFLGGWGLGLVIATWQLHEHNKSLIAALTELEADAQYRNSLTRSGSEVPAAWYRGKALSLLAMNERLRTDGTRSFFMPGSWYLFDDLHERVMQRIYREFGDVAVNTLRRELQNQAGRLSGMNQDDSTGDFVIGASCQLPPSFAAVADTARKASLQLEDQPEYVAMQRYLSDVDQLDAALSAVERLRNPSTMNVEDLRLLVRYTLGVEPSVDLGPSLRYFRDAASGSALAMPLAPIQQAVRCALVKGMEQQDARLFGRNALLESEAAIEKQWPVLSGATNYEQMIHGFQSVVDAIKLQDDVVSAGKAGWIRQTELVLGSAYDKQLTRIAQNRLLGQEVADQAQSQAAKAFQAFRKDFNLKFGGIQSGVVWQDKDARFALSPDRIALRDGLATLLSQPFMQAPRSRGLPELPMRSVLVWDAPRMDQALALGDMRARYAADGLKSIPLNVRSGVERNLNLQFARLILDQVSDAATAQPQSVVVSLGTADMQASSFETSRLRLLKIQTLLTDLGANKAAADLQALVSRDALEHLRVVNDLFIQSDLYAMRTRDLQDWQAGKNPVLTNFGASDVAGLQAFLGQQLERIENLTRQANIYMAALDAGGNASSLAQQWHGMGRDVERYRLKNPNSSLLLLEQFLQKTSVDMDRGNCVGKLASMIPSHRSGDYFSDRLMQIHAALTTRCLELNFRDQKDLWNGFAARFNNSLAAHYPFASSAESGLRVANLGDVAETLASYDAASRLFKDVQHDFSRPGLPGQAARQFAAKFEPVRNLLAPLSVSGEEAQAGYDLHVDMRANAALELEGNKIIDWTLEVGDQALKLRDAPRALRWTYGAPMTLTLRIAKDAPIKALVDPLQAAMDTDGHTVSYRFSDPWALFSMMQKHREGDASSRSESRAQMLKFEFPLQTVVGSDAVPVAGSGRARVFMRVAVSAPGKKSPLPWPASFPSRAVEWSVQ